MPSQKYIIFHYQDSPTKTIRRQLRDAILGDEEFIYFETDSSAKSWAKAHQTANLLIFPVNLKDEFAKDLAESGTAKLAKGFISIELNHDHNPYPEKEAKDEDTDYRSGGTTALLVAEITQTPKPSFVISPTGFYFDP